MYLFQQKFAALDEITVPDPLGMGTQWTIIRDGLIDDDRRQIPEGLEGALKVFFAVEAMPKKMRRDLDADGISRIVQDAGDKLDLGKLMNSDRAIDEAVRRVRNIHPLEVVDEDTGQRKSMPFSAERCREVLTLTEPVSHEIVKRILPIQDNLLPEDGEAREEAVDTYEAALRMISTLGQLLRAWVRQVSSDTERFRGGVIAEAGEASAPGVTTSPETSRS